MEVDCRELIMSMRAQDLTGRKFGRLLVLGRCNDRLGFFWTCRCDCGSERVASSDALRRGKVRSCGCLRVDANVAKSRRHGKSKTRVHQIWLAMRSRCQNPNMRAYHRYGGRGIKVCDRWREFEKFLADMGEPGERESIDRIDNDGNYEPGNCRWVTQKAQMRNRHCNRLLTFQGKTQTVVEWAEELQISEDVLGRRVRKGWDAARALTTDYVRRKRK